MNRFHAMSDVVEMSSAEVTPPRAASDQTDIRALSVLPLVGSWDVGTRRRKESFTG